jgi:hypothetical protein
MRRKNNSLKLFYKLAKRAYKVSKKRKLGWKWSDAQKWTSANLFKKYKGAKNLSKIKVTEIDIEVKGILDGTITPYGKTPVVVIPPKPKKICFNPFEVESILLDSFEWFEIEDKLAILNDDLQVDLDLENQGTSFVKTGVIKKDMLPNLKVLREDMRRVFKNTSDVDVIEMFIVLIEGEVDDTSIACNYYVLITFEGSYAYNLVNDKGLIRNSSTTKEQMPESERERIELFNKQKEEERKLSKKNAQKAKLPTKVEPKPSAKVEPTVQDTKANRTAEYNKAIDKLESLLERKLITKKQFSERFDQLGKNLKDGGEI